MSKLANTLVEVPKGMGLNDKDYCTCLLTTLKEMEKNFAIVMTEASNEWLYDIYRNMFLDIADLQRRLYTLMFQNGWYQLEIVAQSKLDEKYNTINKDYTDLNE